jgi:hypothetical protein
VGYEMVTKIKPIKSTRIKNRKIWNQILEEVNKTFDTKSIEQHRKESCKLLTGIMYHE